ncbi:NUDIX domain-containing protein [Kitasatospora sp. GP82]|uniref:NUDIX hydrolase n=1 Tax=Kitasatospora sp. GP82 TaxID=3035089 RepID=UPI0024739CB5|nr:NUDIX domain-containing protein [Kitasatospora sp. GP82]MDH6128135.1 8-oxo-dGTP diphosphatase [Kitasatospora sp. GP82]
MATGRVTPDQQWSAAYDPCAYGLIAVTVDVVALTLCQGRLSVLLVRRGEPPHQGCWALPGGFLRAGEESLETAAVRELVEGTGLHLTADADAALSRIHLEQLGTYGDPGRDPRMHVISVAYLAFAPDLPAPEAGTDAAVAAWHRVDSLDLAATRASGPSAEAHGGGVGGRTGAAPGTHGHHGGVLTEPPRPPAPTMGRTRTALALDHARILADGLDRARAKLEYSPLATAFLGHDFTIPELRAVYEAVWDEKLHPGNFHRKVLSVPGFVEGTGATSHRGGARGGPRARCYRSGDAQILHPPLLRPAREDEAPATAGACLVPRPLPSTS